jgi:hypothetical protein
MLITLNFENVCVMVTIVTKVVNVLRKFVLYSPLVDKTKRHGECQFPVVKHRLMSTPYSANRSLPLSMPIPYQFQYFITYSSPSYLSNSLSNSLSQTPPHLTPQDFKIPSTPNSLVPKATPSLHCHPTPSPPLSQQVQLGCVQTPTVPATSLCTCQSRNADPRAFR